MESTPLWKLLPRGELPSVRKWLSLWKVVSPQSPLSWESRFCGSCCFVGLQSWLWGRAGGDVGWQSKKSERWSNWMWRRRRWRGVYLALQHPPVLFDLSILLRVTLLSVLVLSFSYSMSSPHGPVLTNTGKGICAKWISQTGFLALVWPQKNPAYSTFPLTFSIASL